MKKFIRNLLSGYFLVILILILELAAVIVLQFYMDDIANIIVQETGAKSDSTMLVMTLIYMGLRLIIFVVALIIFFKIVNKPEDPEFKIPWIVGMLLLPLFTSFVFIIFGNHGLRKQDRIIVTATVNSYNAHFKLRPETIK